MTRQQNTVLWLGLILIFLNIVVHIGDVKSVIFKQHSGPANITNPPPANTGNSINPQNPPIAPGPLSPNAQPTPPGVQTVLWQQRINQDGALPRLL